MEEKKVTKNFTLDKTAWIKFEEKCKREMTPYSRVLNMLITEYTEVPDGK